MKKAILFVLLFASSLYLSANVGIIQTGCDGSNDKDCTIVSGSTVLYGYGNPYTIELK